MDFVIDRPPSSALRELRAHLGRAMTLSGLAGAVALLVLAGPFGTLESLTLAARTGYWGIVVVSTYATGTAIDIVLRPRLAGRGRATRLGGVALATAFAVTALVTALNGLLLGFWPQDDGAIAIIASIFLVAAIASFLLQLQGQATAPAAPVESQPDLLDRLPLDKRGPLVALSVEDHYVRIRTTRGETMLLMRLADAIRETAPTPGLQVHRSHWIAIDAVCTVRREGDRAILTMTTGRDIPASRSHMTALRNAGLLPR
ncbi:LytTR family DNA-binding domain-containing protein [Roseicyclus marinus]|uniref:LytTR family DNA-binding domain-containing protein n=1 Tax=Roseicyclus marinus TaxID=2161673 RepID=UPI00240F6155|nr:LytTR family DNA-binding domain-containing protein [Roseicyclus marinus]MDG3040547.1 LytTR family DNA-binding domain-containing protein [Roseicyclus marinus]